MTTEKVWLQYADELKRFIISKVKNENLTDDILQETFVKIHTKLDTLKDITKLKSWIFTIARNQITDSYKNKSFDANNYEVVENESIEINEHTEKDCLDSILKGLPKKYSEPVFLYDIQGLSQKEIAQKLNKPIPTIKSQIQRARKMIVQGFIDCCGFKLNTDGVLVGEMKAKQDCKICK